MQIVRVYNDSEGTTHFGEVDVLLTPVDFAPPAPSINVSPLAPARHYGFLSAPPGWDGDWHPAPWRLLTLHLAGEVEVEVSDGEVRRFGPGSVVLAEDTSGAGHRSRVVGLTDAVLALVQLPDSGGSDGNRLAPSCQSHEEATK